MALKPTIYKAQVALADNDRQVYADIAVTLALHPSETPERMTARLLAWCLNYADGLQFTRGLSSSDEPDLWRHTDSGEIATWIEVGQPEEPRLRKACGRAADIRVYAFGASADTWWQRNGEAIAGLPRAQVWQFAWPDIEQLAQSVIARTMQLSVNIVGGVVYVDDGSSTHSIEPRRLHSSEA
ncbi:MAG: YaeQ family protein [Halioglobus sp.]|nr:YaeQ family protein [Halioglobus sp.]